MSTAIVEVPAFVGSRERSSKSRLSWQTAPAEILLAVASHLVATEPVSDGAATLLDSAPRDGQSELRSVGLACCLTCRSWTTLGRQLLYPDVKVLAGPAPQSHPGAPLQETDQLAESLAGGGGHAAFVRSLAITSTYACRASGEPVMPSSRSPRPKAINLGVALTSERLCDVICHTGQFLRVLSIDSFTAMASFIVAIERLRRTSGEPCFPGVYELVLGGFSREDEAVIMDGVCLPWGGTSTLESTMSCLPNLERISFVNSSEGKTSSLMSPMSECPAFPNVKTYVWRYKLGNLSMRLFRRSLPTLKSVEIHKTFGAALIDALDAMTVAVEAIDNTLESMRIVINEDASRSKGMWLWVAEDPRFAEALAVRCRRLFAALPHLRAFSFECPSWCLPEHAITPIISAVMVSLPPSVRHVAIEWSLDYCMGRNFPVQQRARFIPGGVQRTQDRFDRQALGVLEPIQAWAVLRRAEEASKLRQLRLTTSAKSWGPLCKPPTADLIVAQLCKMHGLDFAWMF